MYSSEFFKYLHLSIFNSSLTPILNRYRLWPLKDDKSSAGEPSSNTGSCWLTAKTMWKLLCPVQLKLPWRGQTIKGVYTREQCEVFVYCIEIRKCSCCFTLALDVSPEHKHNRVCVSWVHPNNKTPSQLPLKVPADSFCFICPGFSDLSLLPAQ